MDNNLSQQILALSTGIKEDVTSLKTDFKELWSQVTEIDKHIAGLALSDVKEEVKEQAKVIKDLEAFKNKVYGALVITNIVWGIVAALLVNYLKG